MQTTTKSGVGGDVKDGGVGRKFSKARFIAHRLGLCSRTIFRWADAGMITRYKINDRVVLFDEAEVIALIESARAIPPPATGYSQNSP
jgi:hypothetical protein